MESLPPFLPPTEADETAARQPPKTNSTKTLVLWIVLMAMFAAIWWFMKDGAPTPPPRKTCEPCSAFSWWSLVAFLPLAVMFLWMRSIFKATRGYNRDHEPASLALSDGRWAEAASLFAALAQRYPRHGAQLIARYQMGAALLHQGDLDAALREAIASEKGGLLFGREARGRGATQLAQIYALRGELDLAKQWAIEARKRLMHVGDRLFQGALLRVAETALLCRQGAFAEALAGLDRDQRLLESMLATRTMAEVWLLRAFALQQTTDARDAGRIDPWLTLLRTRPRGSLDYLAKRWPELHAFLAAHDLAAT